MALLQVMLCMVKFDGITTGAALGTVLGPFPEDTTEKFKLCSAPWYRIRIKVARTWLKLKCPKVVLILMST